MAPGLFKQERGAARAQHAVADLGHLEARIDLGGDALQLAVAFELREEVAEVGVLHGGDVTKRAATAPVECGHGFARCLGPGRP